MMVSGAGTKHYFHQNHLYSVSAMTDGAGAVVERYRYDAYGKRTVLAADGATVRASSSHGMHTGFTGRYHDVETGLIYFRSRYLSPTLGRFIGRDNMGMVDGWSLYPAYFVPNRTDPSGNKAVTVDLTWGPIILTDCGSAQHAVNFKINETANEPFSPGYVYQKVDVTADIKSCSGSPVPSKNVAAFKKRYDLDASGDATWFERWGTGVLPRHGTVVGPLPTNKDDKFGTIDEGGCTKGTIIVRGEVKWVSQAIAATDTDWQSAGNPPHMPRAMQVRTYSTWNQWGDIGGSGFHEMKIEYSCCDPGKFIRVTVKTESQYKTISK